MVKTILLSRKLLREPGVARPTSPRLDESRVTERVLPSAHAWLNHVPEEYRGELVALINILTGNIPVITSVIDSFFASYSYERIQGVCDAISNATSDKSVRMPEETRRRLVILNEMLCNSEHFWELKTKRDFDVTDKVVASTWKRVYKILDARVRIQYITLAGSNIHNNLSLSDFSATVQQQIQIYNGYLRTEEVFANYREIPKDDIQKVIPGMNDYSLHIRYIGPRETDKYYIANTDGKSYKLSESTHPYLSKQLLRLLTGLREEQKVIENIQDWSTDHEGTSWHVVKSEKAIYVYTDKESISWDWFSGGEYVPRFKEEWQNKFANSKFLTYIKLSLE